MILAIAGAPGTGTTTLSKLLHTQLDWPHVYAGQVFRMMAQEHGMSLNDFNHYVEKHPEVDRQLDHRMVDIARTMPNVILEGRMAVWHVQQAGVPALKVLLTASEDVRAARVGAREGRADVAGVLRENQDREASETKRYIQFYGMDPSDAAHYDVVIDSASLSPQQIADRVKDELQRRKAL